MYRPLALPGEGLHFAWVTRPFIFLLASLTLWVASPAMAQVEEADPDRQSPLIIIPELQLEPPALPTPDPDDLPAPDESIPEAPIPDIDAPDYSRLSSNEEREARLEDMFERLALAETEESGDLIAEEIWAVWLDSGSGSVNLVLRRGAEAQARNDNAMARVMYDHVTRLQPNYAEGWARSSRLALEERDFARAVGEAVRTLTIEPRHFYALWTLGNVLERLGRPDEALDAYNEANRLHPTLETVADRVAALELQLGGGVL
jgi:tetratricopeptide (TPR) repeat protein